MKIKCNICDRYIDNKPCPYLHTGLELERGSKRAVRKTANENNARITKEYERNERLIKNLTREIEQISNQIKMDAARKKLQEAGYKIHLFLLCPECGRIGEPINDPALSWKCPECGRMFRVKDPEGIERLKAGSHSDDNKINEGGRTT